MPVSELGCPNYWLSVLTLNEDVVFTPEYIVNQLELKNIESRPLWKPMHLQPIFLDAPMFYHHETECVGSYLFQYGICLPSGSSMTQTQQSLVLNTINEIFASVNK
ncbi:putative pyridoxal phosphate-dependent aminotransferase EpsN [compost metagenome]